MSFQFLSENYYNGAQWYEQFLQVSHLCEALILLGLALSLFWAPQCLRSSWCYIDVLKKIFLTSFSLPFSELSLVGWPVTSLTNHCPSVLWHCWLGHLTGKNRPRNDLSCVEWDVKLYYTYTYLIISIVWRRHHNGLLLCKNNWAETTDVKVGQSSDVGLWVRPPGNSWPLIRWVCLCDLTHKCLRRGVRCYCLQQWILNCNSYVAVQIFCYISAV